MNPLCFIGCFQFLAGFLITKSIIPLTIFLNGIILHSGYRFWKIPDIIANVIFMVWTLVASGFDVVAGICFFVASLIFILNEKFNNNLIHVVGVQFVGLVSVVVLNKYDTPYMLRLPIFKGFEIDVLPQCVLLGIIVYTIIDGASRLETSGPSEKYTQKVRLTLSPTAGTGTT